MKVLIIILMFLVNVFAANGIIENGRKVEVGAVTTTRHLTGLGCAAVAIITVAYDVVNLYLLLHVV